MARIFNQDARRIADFLEPESVQCVVTSPPYWGLRDYGLEPSMWGGDAACDHEWVESSGYIGHRGNRGQVPQTKWRSNDTYPQHHQERILRGYCLKCGAWRGCLGLEPTPDQYVANIVEVFRGVWTVLRKDGTVWLNLGDSYAANRGNTEENPGYDNKAGDNRLAIGHKRIVNGLKPKDICGIPWRVAFALQADGWYLRSDIIWAKPNQMPESVTDRPTKAHEYIFLLSKSPRYYYDAEAIKEPLARPEELLRKTPAVFGGRNKHEGYGTRKHSGNEYVGTYTGRNRRSVWTIATQPFPEAHFATFPEKLPELCILAGSSPKACPKCGAPWERVVERERIKVSDSKRYIGWQPTCSCPGNDGSGKCIVLDPFAGSGTTLAVAERLQRDAVGFELNPEYVKLIEKRLSGLQLQMVF